MPRGSRGGTSKGSGIRCVAVNCGNTNADGFSMHKFPRNPVILKKWTDFVHLKRANWNGPTQFSTLCSAHFTAECFQFRYRFEMETTGVKPKGVRLCADAVPTIHAQPVMRKVSALTDTSITLTSNATQSYMPSCSGINIKGHHLEMLSPQKVAACQRSPSKNITRRCLKKKAIRPGSANKHVSLMFCTHSEPENIPNKRRKMEQAHSTTSMIMQLEDTVNKSGYVGKHPNMEYSWPESCNCEAILNYDGIIERRKVPPLASVIIKAILKGNYGCLRSDVIAALESDQIPVEQNDYFPVITSKINNQYLTTSSAQIKSVQQAKVEIFKVLSLVTLTKASFKELMRWMRMVKLGTYPGDSDE